MRKSLTLLAMLVLCGVLAFAQVRVISGLYPARRHAAPVRFYYH